MGKFINYLEGIKSVEERIQDLFVKLDIKAEQESIIRSFLGPLRNKGPVYRFHYDHSLRVALLCVAVAEFMHVDQKALLYAGLLHDIGKVLVPVSTLGRIDGWSKVDVNNIRPHVMDGYKMLRDKFNFTAEVILWHHRFQPNGYPKNLPGKLCDYSLGTQVVIQMYGRILSLCDQFDAFHRVNKRNDVYRVYSGEEIKELMLQSNGDQRVLLGELYQANIFTTYTEPVPEGELLSV